MIGKVLGSRYEILEQLGSGGMAVIYKGRDTLLSRLVTVKVLRPEFTSDDDFIARFRKEAQAVASLSHPHIVSIYDVGHEGEVHYLVMEYVEGDNLKNLISEAGVLPAERSAQIARQVCDALQHAHDNKIVHRDVKPQNILITKDGRVKLTDFGIAREATAATLTHNDTIVGSVHYLSPEQAQGGAADHRSDIYSVGVVLYEMVTGALPFKGETPIGVVLKHIREEPPRPGSLNPAVSPGLERIIQKAMAKNPASRYQAALELASALEVWDGLAAGAGRTQVVADEFVTRVVPLPGPGHEDNDLSLWTKLSRRRRLLLGMVLFILVFLGGGASAFNMYINVPEITMPEVEGETQEKAESILRARGIKNIEITRNGHPTVAQGKVISQDPSPESVIKITRNVSLVVSQGPEIRTVPEVIGLTVSDARIRISQHELNVAEPLKESYSSSYPAGVVFDQDPKPEARLSKGSGVVLFVSLGPQPVRHQVPDLAGLSLEQARYVLEKAGFKLDQDIARISSRDYLPGQVIRQSPGAGEELEEGSVVRVTVSSGPGPAMRLARVRVDLPDNGDDLKHELKIVVKDIRGTQEAFTDTYRSGQRVVKEIPYYGSALVQVFVNNKLAGEYAFE